MVLAGGASRRMGADKATLVVDGRRLGDRALDALRGAGLTELVVVGGSGRFDARPLADDHPGEGPLGAIVCAFHHVEADELVVLPCDLPRVDADAVAALLGGAAVHPDADIVVAEVGGRPAYPIGIWRRTAATRLGTAFSVGERRIGAALAGCRVVEVPCGDGLRDADLPAELASADILPDDPLTEGGSE